MRILILNTSECVGGAAIAARRLCQALDKQGMEARMMVCHRQTTSPQVLSASCSRWHFLWERLRIFLANGLSRRNLWKVDIACSGTDIIHTEAFRQADVIHLHWINQGYLSLGEIRRILASGKKVVWTLHDMWPFTGICHHSGLCEHFQEHCHDCPLLMHSTAHDLSWRVFHRKQECYLPSSLTFVGCSRWIADRARLSALTQGQRVEHIPNPVDFSTFHPMDRQEARRHWNLPLDRPLILFVAAKVTDADKGIHLLQQAYALLSDKPDVVVVGGQSAPMGEGFHSIPYVADETSMATLYAAVDAFVTPSLFENLPNVIAEAMSCGTPCVGFCTGGIPEMIDHLSNGYVARYADAEDLALGIRYVLQHDLRQAAIEKARAMFDPVAVARQYIHVYETE
uniref:Putative group 1 glycosyl transferase n=1 Tax=uncultured bacterium fosmid pJB135F11 TaxID=1478051 RepID=A0A0H3UA85_9BACT|nr:putative group 1 glycosyl transferase [uncultured bacterium fosmid pJB135F11]